MKPALALLGKELGHHGLAVVVAAVLTAACLAIRWFVALEDGEPTLIASATAIGYYVLPMAAIWLNERLVVADRVARTHEFLAALPVAPLLRDALRAVLGAGVLLALGTALLLSTALLASRREGVPLLWLAQVWLQLSCVLVAWHGVAFGVAHLGRWRWLVWWCWSLLAVVLDAWLEHPWRTVWWTAPLADPIDQSRSVVPWSAFPIAWLWALGGYALGLALASWRAGALPARWFETPTAVQRATVIGSGVVFAIVATQVSEAVPRADRWSALRAVPGERSTLRVAAADGSPLDAVARDAATLLDDLGARVGVDRWPTLVLLRARSEAGQAVRVATDERQDVARVVLVDVALDRATLTRAVVTEVLWARATDVARRDPDAWPLRGAAAWLQPDDVVRARAARAVGRFDPGDRWLEVERALGPAVAEGVAWAGLEAVEAEAGPDAVHDALAALLRPRRSHRWAGAMRLAWTTRGDGVARWTGVPPARRGAAWLQALGPAASVGVALPSLTLEEIDGEVLAAWDAVPPDGTVLRWTVLDPLHEGPMPLDDVDEVPLERGERQRPLPVDPRARIAVELAVDDPGVAGRVTTGWGARR